jgi:hypothetical protein
MADLTPTILGPDGTYREDLVFTTTREDRFFVGVCHEDTTAMEVSINGSGYTQDSDLITFEDTTWRVPNPSTYPSGLALRAGSNTIQVRAISMAGSTSGPATATATLVQEADIGVVAVAPTNISVEQKDGSVEVTVEGLDDDTGFRGFNFYASQYEGGGSTGYQRINLELVADGTTTEEATTITTLEVDSEVVVDGNGDPVADPLYFRLQGDQEDVDEDVLQEDFDEVVEVPESARALRTTIVLDSVRELTEYSFDYSRTATATSTPPTISIGEFAAVPQENPLYYVVTSVFYDSSTDLEYESNFSQEVVGHPLKITGSLGTFPVVSRQQIVRDFITSVFRSNPQVKVEEGSSLRETVIDPFSTEAERVRFIVDFLHRAQSPTQLLNIDDPQGTGTSAPVATSAYKQALKAAFMLASNSEVQALINAAFDSYASKFGVSRRAGRAAQGEVVFFTSRRPTRTLPIALGSIVQGGSIQFRTTRAASILLNELASYYDPVSGRYKVTVPIRATAVGSSTTVGVGQIRRIVSNLPGLSVTNPAATFGGSDQETNKELVERAQNRIASVDSGTRRGYLQTAADVAGVVRAKVVAAGDALMQRDLDASGVHRGGKVDVWVQGENVSTVTDTFAFTFEIGQDIQFEIIGSPSNLAFKAVDSELSTSNPIVEMLDYPDAGYEFRNASTGEVFDLTGVTITGYNTIQLDTTAIQPAVDLTDVVLGSYRRRVGDTFQFARQPVSAVSSVVGVVSGSIPSTSFALFHPDDPLAHGRSTLAEDYLQITAYTDSDGNTVPSGDLIEVEDESHVLVGDYIEYLDSLGAVFLTVEVWNSSKTVQYKGPDDPSGDPDFRIILGTQTTPLGIQRVDGGDIASGTTVLVDYSHDENFTVSYTTNLMVSLTQDAIDAAKHATADVIAKAAIPAPLDLESTVILRAGSAQDTVDPALRTNTVNFMADLRLGDPVRQSDQVDVIENTTGVSYVVVPFAKMVLAEDTPVVRESLVTSLASQVTQLASLSTSTALTWIIEDGLAAATTNGGGAETEFRGVFEDDVALTLLEGSAQLSSLGLGADRAYIVGSGGAVIQGYSDDATLTTAGFATAAARLAERLRLTANHILVSLIPGDTPISHEYTVTYVVGTDTGAKNIDPGDAGYVTTGTMVFTYDQDE